MATARRRTVPAPTSPGAGDSPLARAITPKLLLLFIVGDILGAASTLWLVNELVLRRTERG